MRPIFTSGLAFFIASNTSRCHLVRILPSWINFGPSSFTDWAFVGISRTAATAKSVRPACSEAFLDDFSKIKASNDNEIDFKLYVNSFANNYKVLSANEFILRNAKTLLDDGVLSKDDYNQDIEKSKVVKDKYLQEIKSDIESILKYYE